MTSVCHTHLLSYDGLVSAPEVHHVIQRRVRRPDTRGRVLPQPYGPEVVDLCLGQVEDRVVR